MRFYLLIFLLVLTACSEQPIFSDNTLNYLPQYPIGILKINHLNNFKSELKNSAIIEKTEVSSLYKTIQENFESLTYLDAETKLTLGFYEVGKSNIGFLAVLGQNTVLNIPESLNNKSVESLTYEDQVITKYTLNDHIFFGYEVNDRLIISTSKMLLENSIRSGVENMHPKTLKTLYNTSSDTKTSSLLVHLKTAQSSIENQFFAKKTSFSDFADWISIDFNSTQNELLLSGITMANDSVKNLTNLFQKTKAQPFNIGQIAPKNSDAIITFTFNDFNSFSRNRKQYLDNAQPIDTTFNTVDGLGIIYLKDRKAVALNSFGAENLANLILSKQVGSESYQGKEIYRLNDPDLITNSFNPLISDFKTNFVTLSENTFIFSNQKETLQNIIAARKSNTTFDKSPTFVSAQNVLASEASILFISNENNIERVLDDYFKTSYANEFRQSDFKDFTFAAQFVADKGFLHTNFLIKKTQTANKNTGVSPLFNVELDSDLATAPQFVKNHRTNSYEIVVQDIDHNLYLISTKGKVLWKKQLEGRIRGHIEQVDLFKNGKLQLAFCTNNRFLIVDRNGEIVSPFNKSYDGGNLNALAVFDYENNRNYRFLVTQGNKTFMYNNQGAIVDGYTYKQAKSSILRAPKHFRIGKKDYIAYMLDDRTLTIRHRAGQERIKVSTAIDFSENEIFLYKNKFTLTDKNGVLHQIDTRGKLNKVNFNLGEDHGIYTTSKTLVLMNENTLSIKGKKVQLELGVYSKPKIFYINDKIYVTVTDIQNQQIYLFDSQAKPIRNFPVYGNSAIDLIDMDGDSKLELVGKDQENSIIVYKMD